MAITGKDRAEKENKRIVGFRLDKMLTNTFARCQTRLQNRYRKAKSFCNNQKARYVRGETAFQWY